MKVDRLISIIMLLLDKKRIGAQELAETFEVSPRTIYRDIDAICMAGIPVRSIPGVSGGFEIMPNYKADSKVFTNADLSAILTGLYGMSNLMRGDELINALAKVKSFIPAERAREIERRAKQIHIDLNPWLEDQDAAPYFEEIQSAIHESKLISFSYADRNGNETLRTVEPYRLFSKASHWYLESYCLLREDFRLFRLSRMADLQTLCETFEDRESPESDLDFPEFFDGMKTYIQLRIHKSILDRVQEYCGVEILYTDGDEYSIAEFPFIENDYYYGILLSFGEKCECIEPPDIRAELGRRAQNIAALYEK
ncbi:MAG: YafY family transcriptional regulator [Oscillospiraceae bacterium]|jgi:predicted DNA-binding transcriptional regulator YafY|nr:YafY family transcriptional regulator [Oscillospiraceae bacterium]